MATNGSLASPVELKAVDTAWPLVGRLKLADGHFGLPEAAPFDSIIVAAAGAAIPADLLRQLAPGGRLVLPVGGQSQYLCMVEHTAEGFVETRLDPVRFVPLLPGTQ